MAEEESELVVVPTASSSSRKLPGLPMQIVLATADHKFELDEKCLERVLMRPDVRHKKVAVVAVAGAFRKGKSFLLDFFLRYLQAEGDPNWLGDDDAPLEGFAWRGGSERETTGILMWSEPFFCRMLGSGEKIAILLMDTQGAFDSESTVRDCATIFALSTMLSSTQVYNVSQNIQEDDLQHLQLFTEYGRLALSMDSSSKPFQALQFLVRDWSFPYEAEYGMTGGRKILNRRLQMSDKQHEELKQIRRHISSCFEHISCFLMPHPGISVATKPNFDGRLRDIEPDFREQLQVLVPMLLAPENIVLKEINGVTITAQELVEYFKAYMKIYQGEELPEPKTMLQATAEANNLAALANAKTKYSKDMETVCGGDMPYLRPDALEQEHQRFLEAAIETFRYTKKMGGPDFSQSYEEQLQSELVTLYDSLRSNNDSKNLLSAAKTPAILLISAILIYVLSKLFDLMGLRMFSNIVTLCMLVVLCMLAVWVFARFTGEQRELAMSIDQLANNLWQSAIQLQRPL